MLTFWGSLACVLALFGLPLLAIGLVLLPCETIWPHPLGLTPSRVLLTGILLCLPLLHLVICAVLY
jgi:hypothetical protein